MTISKMRACRAIMAGAGFCALVLGWSGDAGAWTAATGPRGGAVAAGPRGAVAVGPHGGAAAAGPRGAVAVGPHGGAAAAGPRGAVAVGPNGGAAAVARPGYPGYPAYGAAVRPPYPAPVPVYPGYGRPVAPVATAAAVGVVAGATAGAVAAASAPPPVVVAPPAMVVGASLAALPAGCGSVHVAGINYYQCGTAWVRPYMQGPHVTYVVVPAP